MLMLIVHMKFRKINFRSCHQLPKHSHSDNFQITVKFCYLQTKCKMTERKSSISELNSSDTKQTSTTQKPPNPRKCHSNYESKAAAELDEDIVLSTLDSTPSTLSVNAIQSKFPDHISDEHLRQHFSKYEKYILHAVILRSRRAKYGLITFSSYDIAETARKAFRNKRLLGCLTRLNHFGPTNNATPRDQMPSKVASFVPSMTDSQAPASVCIDKQSDTKILHQASEIGPAVSSGDPPTGNNTLCVEGIHSNLPDEIGDEELMKHFSAFGNDIISASIVRNPQTKLSAGYGVITFKSPAIAKKAQKKYNGTHLCRKYQLRVTLKNPTFSTRSVILVAKGDEGIGPGVLNSSNDRGVLESNPSPNLTVDDAFPAFTMKQESQKANGCNTNNSSFASEADVSDSIDIKSLKKEENSCSNTEGLVIENLSCIIDESEIKALISNCGAEVLSCTILPNPVAVNTCVANVSLADSSLAGNIIKQLNDKEVYGCRLQVRFAEMKHREPLLHVEERKVSLALFNFIAKQSCLQIKTFEQKGCAFYYQETKGCAVLSAPGENIATEFLLQVFNKYTEKTIVFKPNKWEQLTIVRDKHTPSLLNRAGSKVCAEADAQIIPQIDQHEILFVGTHEGVTRTSSWLMDELNREIQIER